MGPEVLFARLDEIDESDEEVLKDLKRTGGALDQLRAKLRASQQGEVREVAFLG